MSAGGTEGTEGWGRQAGRGSHPCSYGALHRGEHKLTQSGAGGT